MTIKSVLAIVACGVFTACAAGPYDNGYSGYSPAAAGGYGNAPVVAYGGYDDTPSYGDRRADRYDDRYGDSNWTPPGSYRDSCRDIVVRRGMLEATCGGDNGGRRTAIPLSSCRSGSFENINGNLQCMGGRDRDYGGSNRDLPPGSYLQSCSDVGIRGGVLEATCGGSDNRRVRSSISLRSCRSGSFSNINGYLQCDR
ncbi:CVNH domain-containing protein [Collimonas sp. OK242]|uniref:CVNH domain-containing protein n=1 Tax=Collimonas sp. OK242 TaxID=1798195 RepID=UPI000895C3F1|nr:CVNH domain-containing protein [Collimonas sp. OK242]SDY28392.1 CVNH domain-containing protein [Collimonas sp. OK242]